MVWTYFYADGERHPLQELPDRPPWREFLSPEGINPSQDDQGWNRLRQMAQTDRRSQLRGKSFQLQRTKEGYSDVVDAVNAAIHLRRPLLVTGIPGSGKTSLAYAIAYELDLGPVLTWPITTKSTLTDAEYRYEAIARLQDAQLDQIRRYEAIATLQGTSNNPQPVPPSTPARTEGNLGDYIQLGPVGTAFLPSRLPRVLLIDEIDKSDLNLPNELLNLFEEGWFEIPELARQKRQSQENADVSVQVRTHDPGMDTVITNGRVQCCEFPIVIMTSNGEREFPPAFYRRCLRVRMPNPTSDSLTKIVQSHFNSLESRQWTEAESSIETLIQDFLDRGNKADRATDQLLNAIYLMTRDENPSEAEMERLKTLLFKRLNEAEG